MQQSCVFLTSVKYTQRCCIFHMLEVLVPILLMCGEFETNSSHVRGICTSSSQFYGGGSAVVDLLFMYFPLFVGALCMSLFCYAYFCVLSSLAIILKRKRELVALLLLSYGCLVTLNVL